MASQSGGGGSGQPPLPQGPPHPGPQFFSLRWNNHPANLVSVFSGLYTSETLVDVTLAAEGRHIQAHKMLLSACSDYFQSLFSVNPCQHPIVILKDVPFEDLQTVVQFMYNGVVNVSAEKLTAVLKTADTLQIKGLGEKFSESVDQIMRGGGTPQFPSAGTGMRHPSMASSSRLLSVPSQHSESRQMSTESLPEYFHRARDLSPRRQASADSYRQCSIESVLSSSAATAAATAAVAMASGHRTVGGGGRFGGIGGVSVHAGLKHAASTSSPPVSPPSTLHYRKKFRMSREGSSSDRGNSLEDDRHLLLSPRPPHPMQMAKTSLSTSASSPPPVAIHHLSPSRQSSSSTDHGIGDNTTAPTSASASPNPSGPSGVAKKKRELFSSRSSRSGGSGKSSGASDFSRDHSFRGLQSSDSSHSINQSQEEPAGAAAAAAAATSTATTTTAASTTSSSLTVPSSLAVPSSSRLLTRTQSAGEAPKHVPSSPPPSPSMSSKRSRFLLKRQDCLEKGIDLTMDSAGGGGVDTGGGDASGSSQPVPPARPTVVKSSPNSPLMGYPHGGIGSPEFQQSHGDPMSSSSAAPPPPHPPPLVKQRSQPLPGETIFSPSSSPRSLEHQRLLPSVRVIPDASCTSPGAPSAGGAHPPVPNMRLLCPPEATGGGGGGGGGGGRLVKSRSTDSSLGPPYSPYSLSDPHLHRISFRGIPSPTPLSTTPPAAAAGRLLSPHIPHHAHAPPALFDPIPLSYSTSPPPPPPHTTSSSSRPPHPPPSSHPPPPPLPPPPLPPQPLPPQSSLVISPHFHPQAPPPPPPMLHSAASVSAATAAAAMIQPVAGPSVSEPPLSLVTTDQFGHCPKAREGPALGCNFCWNTTDSNGRILRRKTKYHCPDCQANLCIVPCFQQYHEALEREKGVVT